MSLIRERMQKGKEPDPQLKPEPNCKPNLCPNYYFNPSSDHYLNSNPNRYSNFTNDPDNCLNLNPDFSIIAGPSHGYIDGSAGALVWVRRRNGSWWPGRILAPEELPGSHLLSPRTGTPVKLLGREDGSVDWYNIEKSRRVKAFRCGEFDQCIQKALSLASALSKKREKYARREDAILHALELEKNHANENQMLGISAYMDKDYIHMSDFGDHDITLDKDINVMIPRGNLRNLEIPTDSGQASLDSIFDSQGNQSFLHPEWDDDDVESIPHVRGLEEVGLKIAASKETKSTWSDAHGGVPYAFGAEDGNKVGTVMGGILMSPLVNSKNSPPVSKRKIYTDMNIIEDEDCFKKRRHMTHELQSGLKCDDCNIDLDPEVPSSDFDVNARRNGNILKATVFADKQCSSFPDNVSYDRRPYLYPCSQHEVKYSGITFVDSFRQGNSTSRASLFCGTGCSGSVGANDSDTGKTKPFMMNEYTSLPLSNFNVCSNYSHKEEPYEKPTNVSRSRGPITGKKMDPTYELSLEISIPDDVLSTYSFYNDRLDENSIFLKRSSDDGEDSLMFYRTDMGNEMMKPSMQVFKQCLSVVAEEEDEEERYLRGEDEADSLQPISGPSLSSPEGWDMHESSSGLSKEKGAADSSSSFYDPYDVEEPNEVRGTHNSPSTKDDDFADPFCKLSSCTFGNIMNPLTGCKSIDGNTLPKWQTKGLRKDRTRCIGRWGSVSIGLQSGSLFYAISESEEMALGKPIYMRKSKYSLEVNLRSDGKADILGTIPCSSDSAHKKDACNSQAELRYQFRYSTWIDVQVQVKDIVRQNVALVSIRSKLNGKAISGHPIQVEVIQKQYGNGLCSSKYSLHPAWRTGRRTTMQCIPRCVLSQDYVSGAGDNLKEIMKKPRSHVCSFTRRRKKPSRKHALVPMKTRMLSSISILKTNTEPKITRPPVVTCVPVSVIFNRIREVLYRGSNHVVSDSDNK